MRKVSLEVLDHEDKLRLRGDRSGNDSPVETVVCVTGCLGSRAPELDPLEGMWLFAIFSRSHPGWFCILHQSGLKLTLVVFHFVTIGK